MSNNKQQTAVEWLYDELTKVWYDVKSSKELLEQAKEMEELRLIKVLAEQSTKEAAKTKELLDFLNAQISKNRSYSASTMCEVIIEFITTQQNK